MSRFFASATTTGLVLLLAAAMIPAQAQTTGGVTPVHQQSVAPAPLSKVRIVRLSDVRGAVQLDRGDGLGFEPAILNMPVVEQSRLETAVGVAEVELEDDSSLRIGPNSEVQFQLLGRTAQGSTVSTVRVLKGIAYVSLVKAGRKAPNVFNLSFGSERSIPLQPGSHVRLDIAGQHARLAVLGGNVQLEESSGPVELSRNRTATFAMVGNTQPAIAKGVTSDPLLDSWDKQSYQYHSQMASLTRFGSVPFSYGLNDMLYYGAFQNAGGCGMMWRPYFAGTAWNPYGAGTWANYLGAGYSWVSPYPWGWTPYHYGSWSFCPGSGWGWMPGGNWQTLNNTAFATAVTPVIGTRVNRRHVILPRRPRRGGASLITVNESSLVHSGINKQGAFVFVRNSAGLGVPREELGGLKSFSRRAERRGYAVTPIYIAQAPQSTYGPRGQHVAAGPIAIRRGYAPNYGFAAARTSVGVPRASGMPVYSARSAPVSMPSAPSMASMPSMSSSHASAGVGHR